MISVDVSGATFSRMTDFRRWDKDSALEATQIALKAMSVCNDELKYLKASAVSVRALIERGVTMRAAVSDNTKCPLTVPWYSNILSQFPQLPLLDTFNLPLLIARQHFFKQQAQSRVEKTEQILKWNERFTNGSYLLQDVCNILTFYTLKFSRFMKVSSCSVCYSLFYVFGFRIFFVGFTRTNNRQNQLETIFHVKHLKLLWRHVA